MDNVKHTPEPWHAPGLGEIHAENHDEIAAILFHHEEEDGYCGTEADAKRIVACVNACAGMADPAKEIATLRQQLAEQTSGEPWHGHEFKELKHGLWKCKCGKELHTNPNVEVLLEALRSASDLLSAVDGISRNNFSQLASEEIQAIDKLISSYKPTEG